EMIDLWTTLAQHAAPAFDAFTNARGEMRAARADVLDRLPEWSTLGSSIPRTLIHHDFNPRNLVLRAGCDRSLRLCAFDWELATVGMPQRDLAELLCFTLPEGVTRAGVDDWVERHRRALARETGRNIDP